MIPRTLLRQTRAVSSSIRTVPRSSLARPQFRQSNVALAPASRLATSRWYSTEPEAKTTEGDAAAESKIDGKSTEAEDPAKKELEAKNKEIIDLKVTPHPPPSLPALSDFSNPGSIPAVRRRIPQSTGENEA